VKKYGRAEQGIHENMAHAHCMLDTSGYKHTLRVYKTYYISTAKTVEWTHLNVTIYIYIYIYIYNFYLAHSKKN